jgi:DHA1 family multidrug resistance protein-like MFS transporter
MEMWRKNLWVLVVAVILSGASYTMLVPFLPIFLLDLGVTVDHVKMWSGVIFAASFLVAAVLAPYWGRRADRAGKKKMIRRAGFSLAAVYFLGGFVHDPFQLLGVRILQGVASGFVPAAMALVASATPPEKLGFSMGIMQTGLVVGGIIGPLAGGVLAHLFGMRWSFAVAAVIIFAATLAVIRLVEEPPSAPVPQEGSLLADLKQAFGNRILVRMLLLLFGVQMVIMTLQPLTSLYVAELQGSLAGVSLIVGVIFGLSGSASAIAAPLWGRAGQSRGGYRILVAAFVGAGIFNLMQALVGNIVQFGALQFMVGLFLIGVFPSINVIALGATEANFQGRVFGLTNASNQLGSMVGPLVGGFVSSFVGIRPVYFLTGATLLLLGGYVFWGLQKKKQ